MKAKLAGIGALLGLAWLSSASQACMPCYVCSPVFNVPLPIAPSPCSMPGFYTWCPDGTCYGTVYGPNYYLRPPFPPFQGVLPGTTGQAIAAGRSVPAMHGGYPGPMPSPYPGPHGVPHGMPHAGPYAGPYPFPSPGPLFPPHTAAPQYGHPPSQHGVTVFPTHPHVRSPRDFFMWRENMEDRINRDIRPALIP
jgi:hypothetical protein